MATLYLLLGGNMGNRAWHLERGLELVGRHVGAVRRASGVFESSPWGFDCPTPFLNQALEVDTPLSPWEALEAVLAIERQLGRQRDAGGYAPRPLDVDILLYGGLVIRTPRLTVPHPLLPVRRFALTPLCEIAPDLTHPALGQTVAALLGQCPDPLGVWRYEGGGQV